MKDILAIACGAGLQDGLNPCYFMISALFIAHGFWLNQDKRSISWSRPVFSLFCLAGILGFNFGLGQYVILQKYFPLVAKAILLFLSIWSFVLGVLSIKDWFLIRRGISLGDLGSSEEKPAAKNFFLLSLVTIVAPMVVSALATLWPINPYVMILGNSAILKGQWQSVLPMLLTYSVVSLWSLWVVWAFLSIKNLPPAMLKIFCAAVFFTASSCVILIFK